MLLVVLIFVRLGWGLHLMREEMMTRVVASGKSHPNPVSTPKSLPARMSPIQ